MQVTKNSKKFCPEALTFLKDLLLAATVKDPRCPKDSQVKVFATALKLTVHLVAVAHG